jgi:hypothetical protein
VRSSQTGNDGFRIRKRGQPLVAGHGQPYIKVRDVRSYGRPEWVRLATQNPKALEELIAIAERFQATFGRTHFGAAKRPRSVDSRSGV